MKRKSPSSVPAVSKSTVPTRRMRSSSRLIRVDVLHAVDAGLLHPLGEDPVADVEPLRGDHVDRGHALDEAIEQQQHEQRRRATRTPVNGAHGERDDDADGERPERGGDVEAEQRAPRRVALEDDLLAGVQLHGGKPTGERGRPGELDHQPRVGDDPLARDRVGLAPGEAERVEVDAPRGTGSRAAADVALGGRDRAQQDEAVVDAARAPRGPARGASPRRAGGRVAVRRAGRPAQLARSRARARVVADRRPRRAVSSAARASSARAAGAPGGRPQAGGGGAARPLLGDGLAPPGLAALRGLARSLAAERVLGVVDARARSARWRPPRRPARRPPTAPACARAPAAPRRRAAASTASATLPIVSDGEARRVTFSPPPGMWW